MLLLWVYGSYLVLLLVGLGVAAGCLTTLIVLGFVVSGCYLWLAGVLVVVALSLYACAMMLGAYEVRVGT